MISSSRLAVVTFVAVAPMLAVLGGCQGGASCAEGATKNADTRICMKLPADFSFDEKAQKSGDSSYLRVSSKKGGSFTIWIEKPDDLDKRGKAVANMAGSDLKLVDSGDTAPSKGKFFHFHNTAKNYDFAVALIPGKEHFYRCEIQNTAPAEAKPELDACKTLSGP